MSSERWQQIERLYHAALGLDPQARAAFLAEACTGDAELQGEVAALLAFDERAEGFLESPALELAARALASDEPAQGPASRAAGRDRSTALAAGMRLGPYDVVAPVGAGGMGEVYKARDTRLGREVALKVISPRMVGDALPPPPLRARGPGGVRPQPPLHRHRLRRGRERGRLLDRDGVGGGAYAPAG